MKSEEWVNNKNVQMIFKMKLMGLNNVNFNRLTMLYMYVTAIFLCF